MRRSNVGYKDDCVMCIHIRMDGTCGNKRSIMYGIKTNEREAQLCECRQYYTQEAARKVRKRRKIESVYDYE